jgi:tripartite ATP-independent transporter DctP family solute receptor
MRIMNRKTTFQCLNRRTLLKGAGMAGAVALCNIRTRRARAADYTINWALNLPVVHPEVIRAREASEKILAETNGSVLLQVFPSNQMGADSDMLNQVRSGALHMACLASTVLSTYVPTVAIDGLGFLWKDYETLWKAMDGELGAYVRGQLAKANILSLEKMWDLGFRQITTSNRPINTPEDLKDLRIRVPVTPLWTAMFKAMGASPTTVEWNETYTALQTKVVDAQENPLSLILTAKLYETQKYCSITNHLWTGHWTLLSRRFWERLPDNVRTIVAKNVNAAAMAERADIAKLDPESRALLAAKGLVFNDPDQAPFREALKKTTFFRESRTKLGEEGWALLEKQVGKLG